MIREECLAWDPIPDVANQFWNVDVVHFEESSNDNMPGLSLVVASQWPLEEAEEWGRGAWRISFTQCLGYRMRFIGYHGNPLLTQPDERKATWELFPSMYLVEAGAEDGFADGPTGYRVHHFVIRTGDSVAYELIAATWESEPMSDEWAHPFAYPVPQP